jgi:hypothetical protein
MGGYVGTKAVNLSTTAADVSGDANISGSITASGGTFSGDVDFGANKITYANVYAQLSDLPSASTYHGMFAHVHATGKAYFAHAGAWVPLTSGLGIDDNADATAITIDSSENVGIGDTSPVSNSNYKALTITSTASSGGGQLYVKSSSVTGVFGADNTGDPKTILQTNTNHPVVFGTNGSERARLDASGNLLVGMTTNSVTGTGIGLVTDGTSHMYSGGTHTLELGRGGSDGDILKLNRSGTAVGSIGANGGNLIVQGSTATGKTGIKFGGAEWIPQDNGNSDGGVDLGGSSYRFKDLYLSGGIQFDSRSNKLDDYEEGTFNATWIGNGTSGPSSTMKYTKIGNTVHIFGNTASTVPNPTGAIELSGLPFTPSEDSSGSILYRNVTASSGQHTLVAFIPSSTTNIQPYWSAQGAYAKLQSSQLNFSGSQDMYFGVTYMTA